MQQATHLSAFFFVYCNFEIFRLRQAFLIKFSKIKIKNLSAATFFFTVVNKKVLFQLHLIITGITYILNCCVLLQMDLRLNILVSGILRTW